MVLPKRTVMLTIFGVVLSLAGLFTATLLWVGRWHIHIPVVANFRIEERTFSLMESATDLFQDAVRHDRAGEIELASQDYDCCSKSLSFPSMKAGERKAIRELADTRQNARQQDFIDELICHSQVYYWPKERLPIRVYIPPPRARDGFSQADKRLICDCLNEWMAVVPESLCYRLVSDKDRADMVFTRKRDNLELGTSQLPVAHTSPVSEGPLNWQVGKIGKAKISVVQPDGAFTARNVFLHEIGHALGLAGHSCNGQDVMFPYINYDSRRSLTLRDRETMACIYRAPSLEELAEKQLRKLAGNGDKYALFRLAMHLRSAESDCEATRHCVFDLVKRAAEANLPAAQNVLGSMFAAGEGVPRDVSQALYWWKLAADHGDDRDACLALARVYQFGYGVKSDADQAEHYYRAATELDSPVAEVGYADFLCYLKGDPESYFRAFRYYTLAAESFSCEAMCRLAQLHTNCNAIPFNPKAAKYWSDKAFATIQKCKPADAAGYFERGALWHSIHRDREAITDFNRAEYLQPDFPGLKFARARCYYSLCNFERAEKDLVEAIATNPDDVDIGFLQCMNQFGRGNWPGCCSDSAAFLARTPAPDGRRVYAMLYLAMAFRAREDHQFEKRILETACRECVEGQWPWPILTYLSGKISGEELVRRSQGDDQLAEARTIIGVCRGLSGEREGAVKDLTLVRDRGDPRFVQYPVALGVLNNLVHGSLRRKTAEAD